MMRWLKKILPVLVLVLALPVGASANNRYVPPFTLRVTNSNYLRITNNEATTKRVRCIAVISSGTGVGGTAIVDLNITSGSTGDCQPGSGIEWIIQGVVHEGSINLGHYDGTNLVDFDTDPATATTTSISQIDYTNETAPGTPGSGITSAYVDSTDKRFHDKNDAGAIGTTVVAKDCDALNAGDVVKSVSAAGVVGCATPTAGASSSAHYVTTQSESGLSAEFNLGGLSNGLLKQTVSGGISTPAIASAGTDYVSPSSTETLTNKTLDAEGSGNVISIPVKRVYWGAGCNNTTAGTIWDLPTSTPAVPACVTGTNIQKGVLQFADTTGGFSAQISDLLPADWTSTGGIDATIIWRTSATSGNVKWSLSTACTAVNAAAVDDPAFNTANTVTTAAPGTANRAQTSTITGLTTTGCTSAAMNIFHLKLFRDGNDAADTIGATAEMIGVELTFRRAM